jgi:alkanesulfonate monooxygenase SsuD/methylene tetrahydromethanopterin reductase-like flavin-dependent oxidoreductase (luciferase family)/putative sterol carrier protein
MRFGLFYEHQLPRPWAEGAEEKLLVNALEQVELADRIGFDYVWEVEHHFLEEYSHSSAPEIFLAAASQRTKNIRLGHGIVQLPPTFNHPVRIAERIATLDLISGGRVEFGTGESSSQMELGGFGIPREEKRKQWSEALDAITRMFVEEPFAGFDGEFISVPQRNVVPKPKQKPHPPLWAACSQRDTILLAARNGVGALSFSFVDPEAAKEWVDAYYELIASDECVPAGFAVNPNFAVVVPLMCHEDEETAIQQGIDGGHFFGYSLAHYYVFGEHRPGQTNVWDEFEQHRNEYGFAREIIRAQDGEIGVKVLEGGLGSMRGAIGTPKQITDLVSRYEAVGVDQIIFVAQCGNNVHEQVCASLELFGREVLPRFAEQADAKEAAKHERLSGAIDAAMGRREGPRTADSGYVVTPKGEDKPSVGYVLPGISGDAPARPAPARQTEVFGALVRHLTDEQIADVFGNEKGSAPIFEGMAASFNPEGAMGFVGKIQYRLGSNGTSVDWYVEVDKEKAVAAPGSAERADLTIEASVADFVRIAAGELNGAKAAMEGKLRFEGELDLALRLQRMFGGDSLY